MGIDDIALTLVPHLGTKGIVHLLGVLGSAERVFAASTDELIGRTGLSPEIAKSIVSKKSLPQAERELNYCARHGITPLASTDDTYPELLREIPDYPHVIYVQGHVEALRRTTLTMVGTRKMTHYGQQMSDKLVEQLAARAPGTVIVSGLAFGVDTACHRAALVFGMTTVGVIATALPEITPAQHTAVARDMIEHGGAVVCERHSQIKENGTGYLARNRIMAALSAGTVIVESAREGGSMETARMADGYDRTLMAVPGRATDFMSAGPNTLIRDRKAAIVLTGEDIVREMMWDVTLADQIVARPAKAPVALTRDEAGLLGCFRTSDPVSVDQLCEVSGMGVAELSVILFGLEMADAVRQLPGNRYVKL